MKAKLLGVSLALVMFFSMLMLGYADVAPYYNYPERQASQIMAIPDVPRGIETAYLDRAPVTPPDPNAPPTPTPAPTPAPTYVKPVTNYFDGSLNTDAGEIIYVPTYFNQEYTLLAPNEFFMGAYFAYKYDSSKLIFGGFKCNGMDTYGGYTPAPWDPTSTTGPYYEPNDDRGTYSGYHVSTYYFDPNKPIHQTVTDDGEGLKGRIRCFIFGWDILWYGMEEINQPVVFMKFKRASGYDSGEATVKLFKDETWTSYYAGPRVQSSVEVWNENWNVRAQYINNDVMGTLKIQTGGGLFNENTYTGDNSTGDETIPACFANSNASSTGNILVHTTSQVGLSGGTVVVNMPILNTKNGYGRHLSLDMSYNSGSSLDSVFGKKWTHSANMKITDRGYVVEYRSERGIIYAFLPGENGQLVPFSKHGLNASLEKTANGYKLIQKDGEQYIFNLDGQVTSILGKTGQLLMTYNYNADKLLTSIVDTIGRAATITYNADKKIAKVVDPIGWETKFVYDANGNLSEIQYPFNRIWKFTSNAAGYMLSKTDAIGNVSSCEYNADNKVSKITDVDSKTFLFTYDPNDRNKVAMTDKTGQVSNYEVDPVKAVRTKYSEPGQTSSTISEYNDNRELVKTIAPNGLTTEYTYNANHLPVLVTVKDNTGTVLRITKNYYEDINYTKQPSKKVGPVGDENNDNTVDANDIAFAENQGNYWTWTYNANGDATSERHPDGGTIARVYDTFNRLTSETDALGNTTTYVYYTTGANNGYLEKIVDPLGNETRYTYNASGWKASETDACGNTTSYEYYCCGMMKKKIHPDGSFITYIPNLMQEIVRTIDERGNATVNTYDARKNLKTMTDALGNVTTYYYDANDKLIAEKDARGGVTLHKYDSRRLEVKTIRTSMESGIDLNDPNALPSAQYNYAESRSFYNDFDQLIATEEDTGDLNAPVRRTEFTYDILGRQIKQKDALGNETISTYDAKGRMISATNARGFSAYLTYDNMNRQIQQTDAINNVVKSGYNLNGNRIWQMDARKNVTAWYYDANGRMTIEKRATAVQRDANNNPVFGADGYPVIQSSFDTVNEYDAVGNLVKTTNALSQTTQFVYDTRNRMTKTIDALGNQTVSVFDAVGNTEKTIDAKGNETKVIYDALNRAITVTDALNQTSTVNYDSVGNRSSVLNARGFATNFTYDYLNRTLTVTDAKSNVTTYAYLKTGEALAVRDAEGNDTVNSYDALGRLITKTDVLGNVTTYGYDSVGNLVSIKDTKGNETKYVFDAMNRLLSTTYADNTTIINSYDSNGNILTTVDQNGTVVTNAYDVLNRLTNRNIQRGVNVVGTTAQTFTYDALGKLLSATDNNDPLMTADDSTVAYTYDSLNRLVNETQSIGNRTHTVTSGYDAISRTGLNYPGGKALTFQQDALNRVSNINQTQTIANYQYSATGRVFQKTLQNNTLTASVFDSIDREESRNHTSFGNAIVHFSHAFDKVGNKRYERRTWSGRDQGDFYTYDAIYRLTNVMYGVSGNQLENFKINGTIPTMSERTTNFNMDGVGNRTSVVDSLIGTTNYGVNSMNEYTTVNNTPNANDEAGNLIDDGTKTFKWDFANRLREVYKKPNGKSVAKYAYDAQGRRIARIIGELEDDDCDQEDRDDYRDNGNHNGWDKKRSERIQKLQREIREIENKLIENANHKDKNDDKDKGKNNEPPRQNGKGKLMDGEFETMDSSCDKENNENKEYQKKLENLYRKLARMLNLTGTCYWIYDGDQIVEQRKFNTMLASSWTNGIIIDEPIQIDISGLKYCYHANSLGSIYAMTDSTGAVVERYEYDAYGKVTIYDPTLTIVRTYSIAGNIYNFTGRQLDYETGLYYYRARMYDANTGRFLSHDPLGYIDGMGLFVYVKNQPTRYNDPSGKVLPAPTLPYGIRSVTLAVTREIANLVFNVNFQFIAPINPQAYWNVNQQVIFNFRVSIWENDWCDDDVRINLGYVQTPYMATNVNNPNPPLLAYNYLFEENYNRLAAQYGDLESFSANVTLVDFGGVNFNANNRTMQFVVPDLAANLGIPVPAQVQLVANAAFLLGAQDVSVTFYEETMESANANIVDTRVNP